MRYGHRQTGLFSQFYNNICSIFKGLRVNLGVGKILYTHTRFLKKFAGCYHLHYYPYATNLNFNSTLSWPPKKGRNKKNERLGNVYFGQQSRYCASNPTLKIVFGVFKRYQVFPYKNVNFSLFLKSWKPNMAITFC